MKEIGGYFGLEEFTGKEYYSDLIGVNNGRNALLYIIKAKNIKKIYIPFFLCDSVSELCKREKIDYKEYSIDENFHPLFDKVLQKNEYIYIVNFYGQITDQELENFKLKFGNIIFDNVQAFFRKPVKEIDTIYSCRKFFGVSDGGYVYTDAENKLNLMLDSSKDRMKHILGRFEQSGSEFYSDFQKNDESFYNLELRQMSPITRNILKAIDYEEVLEKRNKNYNALADQLDSINGKKFKHISGAYCYPFYCKNGLKLKRKLAESKIYIATLWPNVLQLEGTLEKDFAENILPLPCDQRYSQEDMKHIANTIKSLIF